MTTTRAAEMTRYVVRRPHTFTALAEADTYDGALELVRAEARERGVALSLLRRIGPQGIGLTIATGYPGGHVEILHERDEFDR